MKAQQIRDILEEVHGIGNRECSPTPDQTIRLCAAILFLHGIILNDSDGKNNTINIYGSMAVKRAADILYDMSISHIIHDLEKSTILEKGWSDWAD